MDIILPLSARQQIADEEQAQRRGLYLEHHIEPENPASLELRSKVDRKAAVDLLSQLDRLCQHGCGIQMPDAGLHRLQRRAIQRLAEDLLGDNFAGFETLC